MDESSGTLLRSAFGEWYGEFRQLASLFVARENFPECPSPTSLVHQAWLRSKNHRENLPISTESIDRAVLATMMERILVEKARSYRRRREILKQAFVTGSYDVAIALRWNEYKVHTSVYLTQGPMKNLDESVLTNTGDWPWVYNLYMDPKEQRSTGHRYFEWGLAAVKPMLESHVATYAKYPRKNLGLATPR